MVTAKPRHVNREAWLEAVVRALRPRFRAAGYDLPTVRVSCGWPHGATAARNEDAECWPPATCEDGIPQVFISPSEARSVKVAGILTHELVHAATARGSGIHLYDHGPDFAKAMRAIGLRGRPASSMPGVELKTFLQSVVNRIGEYPHSRIRPA